MKKIIVALLIASTLLTTFAGCDTKTTETSGTEASGASTTGEAATSKATEGETTTIKVVMMSADKADKDLVVADANAILQEKLNINMDLTFIAYGNYVQQTTLMLSSGTGVDVLPVYMTPLSTVANNGQILPLDDLLAEYGTGIPDAIGAEYIEGGRVGGDLYGITTGRDLAKAYGFEMSGALCEKYNINPDEIKTLDELEAALRIIKENEPDIIPVVVHSGEIFRNWGWDTLGDDMVNLGVLMDFGQDLTVTNLYETEFYKDLVTRFRGWYQDGIIMQDALNNTENGGQMIAANKGFGAFVNLKPGFNAQETRNFGVDIVSAELVPAYASTSDIQMATWTIAGGTKYPEKSMLLLNEMYTNPAIANLLCYGKEGVHYEAYDEAANNQKMIRYPEGVVADTTGYRPSGWLWPNQTIGNVWEGNPPNYWQEQTDFNNGALRSKAYGFTYDSLPVKNQVTACTNVVGKYHQALLTGMVDPETTLPIFIQELKDAGIDDIIAEKQKQIDAWVEAQA